MRKLSLWILIGGVLLGAAACASSGASSTSGAPPASNVAGRWAGPWVFEPSSAGNGQVSLSITQDGRQLKGTIEHIEGPHRGRAGFFNGIMSGNDIQITGPDATGWLKVSGNEMTGTINGILPARLTLRKQ
jgi:hypothetical protein